MAKIKFIYESCTLDDEDTVCRIYATPKSGVITIKLPPVSEGEGKHYSLYARCADEKNKIVLKDQNESEAWEEVELKATGEFRVLLSDGIAWSIVGSSY